MHRLWLILPLFSARTISHYRILEKLGNPHTDCECSGTASEGNDLAEETKVRRMRVVDFVAELLEAEANAMPPSCKEHADILRKQAQTFREWDNPNMVTVRVRHVAAE